MALAAGFELNGVVRVVRVTSPPQGRRVRLRRDDTLRDALDTAITGHTRVAPVFDGDRYLGMLTMDAISREVTS